MILIICPVFYIVKLGSKDPDIITKRAVTVRFGLINNLSIFCRR